MWISSIFDDFISLIYPKICIGCNQSLFFNSIDYIIPVPLHPKKEKIRGYNQSLYIAKGIKEILKIKIDSKSLQRKVNTESQTEKNKYSRWKNVGQVFELIDKNRLSNKHILLVDDVVTTGSTLESCIETLQQTEGIKVSIVTIALA